jgi:hypothetical protein
MKAVPNGSTSDVPELPINTFFWFSGYTNPERRLLVGQTKTPDYLWVKQKHQMTPGYSGRNCPSRALAPAPARARGIEDDDSSDAPPARPRRPDGLALA